MATNKTYCLELKEFEQDFYLTIENHEQVKISEDGVYHTFTVNKEKAGIVGYIPKQNPKGEFINFVQIAILSKFRGKGLTRLAEDLLAKEHHLQNLSATIDLDNITSLKAHIKAGFKELNCESLANLRNRGFLPENQTRLIKKFV